MGTRTILVAIELDTWEPVIAVAGDMAARYGASLVVLHVVPPVCNAYPDVSGAQLADASCEFDGASRLVVEEVASRAGARASIRAGDPTAEILAAIADLRPVHLVLGTHGRQGVRRALLGSVADRVVRSSPVPVTVVPAGAVLAA